VHSNYDRTITTSPGLRSSRCIDEHPSGAGYTLLLKVARETLQERLQLSIRAAR
jgi:hypothetical protein